MRTWTGTRMGTGIKSEVQAGTRIGMGTGVGDTWDGNGNRAEDWDGDGDTDMDMSSDRTGDEAAGDNSPGHLHPVPTPGDTQHIPTDGDNPNPPGPSPAAPGWQAEGAGSARVPGLTSGTGNSRRGWSRSRAPGNSPRGTVPAASPPPPARWARGTSWAQRGHSGPPGTWGSPGGQGQPQPTGTQPHPTGTSCAMGCRPHHGSTQGVGTQGGQRGKHVVGHPDILWDTQPAYGAPKHPMGHSAILRGTQPCHGHPTTPWGTQISYRAPNHAMGHPTMS